MSPHPTNNPTPPPRRSRFAILLAFTAGGAAISGATGSTPGPGTAPPEPVTAPTRVPDVVLARAALAALDADAELRGVTFVVSVVDRVAVVGGPVTSARQSKRAEEVVRGVSGIAEVRNTCFVTVGPDPLLRAVADRMESSLPPRPVFELPGILTGGLTAYSPYPVPAPVPNTAFAAATPPGPVVVRKPAGEMGVLGAPVSPGAGPVAVPPVTALSPGVLTANRPDVLAAVDAVRKAEPRFAKLTAELRDGALVIGGSAPLAADAWDFAKKLQTIPGVARVAVGDVSAK